MTPHLPPRYKITTSEAFIGRDRISSFLIISLFSDFGKRWSKEV